MRVTLTTSPQHFWEVLISDDALTGQSIMKPLDRAGCKRPRLISLAIQATERTEIRDAEVYSLSAMFSVAKERTESLR